MLTPAGELLALLTGLITRGLNIAVDLSYNKTGREQYPVATV